MSIMGLLVLFAIFVAFYLIIIEIFTVLFRLTGLTQEKARTQVISMLTNSGFTTAESELVLSAKKRRRLAQITMMFGYSFTVIIVSTIVNIFLAMNQAEITDLFFLVIILVAFLAVLFTIMRLRIIRTKFDHFVERLGNRIMFGKNSNPVVLIDIYKDKAMVEIELDIVPSVFSGRCLGEMQLIRDYDIHVLYVKRDGLALDEISKDTVFEAKDSLVLFGNYKNIRLLFEHPNKE